MISALSIDLININWREVSESLKLLKESQSILELLEQLSTALSSSVMKSEEVAWEGYLINICLAKSKIEKACSLIELDSSVPVRKKLSPSIAKRIREAPKGSVKEIPINYIDSLEDLDEDQMVFDR